MGKKICDLTSSSCGEFYLYFSVEFNFEREPEKKTQTQRDSLMNKSYQKKISVGIYMIRRFTKILLS